ALATEPNILLLDEPFSALDDDTRQNSQEELLRIHKLWKIPVIVVTHNRTEAVKLGNRILYINEGKLSND
ncbi:MAG TPA: ABC transporter ATP-binding protein, partial [Virgibacillus sp.]|nr:ABC transporter ATP-binding protein [Virgibacillus sp.]